MNSSGQFKSELLIDNGTRNGLKMVEGKGNRLSEESQRQWEAEERFSLRDENFYCKGFQ